MESGPSTEAMRSEQSYIIHLQDPMKLSHRHEWYQWGKDASQGLGVRIIPERVPLGGYVGFNTRTTQRAGAAKSQTLDAA